ncbi:MAG TPA: DUF3365 domain-containing protein [Chitinophagaceae bacterium]|nr:DUF3365 domain-containing protein [Chitinophagaceae bacterium]
MLSRFYTVGLSIAILFSCKTKVDPAEGMVAWKNKGDSLVNRSFDTLRNTLLKAIGENGFAGAVTVCNTGASGLMNVYAGEGTSIRRATEKFRNPANRADSTERKMIRYFRELMRDKKELTPITEKDAEGKIHYFKPILVQAMCLNCHGDKITQIKPDTWQTLQEKYPGDLAYDYKEGELRGIWHLVFSNRQTQ